MSFSYMMTIMTVQIYHKPQLNQLLTSEDNFKSSNWYFLNVIGWTFPISYTFKTLKKNFRTQTRNKCNVLMYAIINRVHYIAVFPFQSEPWFFFLSFVNGDGYKMFAAGLRSKRWTQKPNLMFYSSVFIPPFLLLYITMVQIR